MFSRLTALVGGGSSLPFDLGEEYPSSSAFCGWKHFRGTSKADGSAVSVFRLAATSKGDQRLEAGRNAAKRLRTLRHPNILTFKELVEVEERSEAVIYLVTEPVTPLDVVLSQTMAAVDDLNQYLTVGLGAVVGALSFLTNDCGLVHGAVCMSAVMVTQTLDWKLHGFDVMSEHQFASQSDLPLTAAAWLVPQQYKPGEVAKGDWQAVKDGPAWGVDAWGLGCLMQEVYSGSPLSRTEDLRNTERIPKELLQYYQRLLASQPARRLNPRQLLEAGVLRNRLSDATSFLENLAIKDAMEKDLFFKKLPSLLPSIPTLVAQRKLLPMLANAIEFGGAPPVALTTLLEIGKTLPEEDYSKQVVPILTKLFASSDRGIRRGLLENIATFGPSLQNKVVEEQIYNQVASGFSDGNPYLRELTLKAMAVLGPKLSQKTLNQSLLKHLAKLQVDEEASIRANTTVLLGNLASHLSEATCKKVLLNAFTRALRDGFPPARVAGLKAIVATAQYHSPEDAATRVLPAVGPLCIDAVHEVRTSALACVERFTKELQQNHRKLERKAAAMQEGEAGAGSDANAPPGSNGGSSLLNSVGWAVSNLGLGRSTATDAAAAKPTLQSASMQPAAAASLPAGSLPPAPAPSASLKAVGTQAAPPAASSGGWEDMDDDALEDMMGADDLEADEQAARQRLSKIGLPSSKGMTASRPAAALHSAKAAEAPKSGGEGPGWDNTDGGVTAFVAGRSRTTAARPTAQSVALSAARRPVGARAAGSSLAGGSSNLRKPSSGGGMKLGSKLKEDSDFLEW